MTKSIKKYTLTYLFLLIVLDLEIGVLLGAFQIADLELDVRNMVAEGVIVDFTKVLGELYCACHSCIRQGKKGFVRWVIVFCL